MGVVLVFLLDPHMFFMRTAVDMSGVIEGMAGLEKEDDRDSRRGVMEDCSSTYLIMSSPSSSNSDSWPSSSSSSSSSASWWVLESRKSPDRSSPMSSARLGPLSTARFT